MGSSDWGSVGIADAIDCRTKRRPRSQHTYSRDSPLAFSSARYWAHCCVFLAAELGQIRPREQAGIVAVVEHDAHRVVADRPQLLDLDVALLRHRHALARTVPLHLRRRARHPQHFGRQIVVRPALERRPSATPCRSRRRASAARGLRAGPRLDPDPHRRRDLAEHLRIGAVRAASPRPACRRPTTRGSRCAAGLRRGTAAPAAPPRAPRRRDRRSPRARRTSGTGK